MAYLQEADYTARFGSDELEQVLASGDGTTLAAAIADAEAIVDGYLAAIPNRTFAVPLQGTPPPRIVEITADLARYEIHVKKVTHEIKRRRNQAIDFLEKMARGIVAIPGLIDPNFAGGIDLTSEARVFDAATLAGYVGG